MSKASKSVASDSEEDFDPKPPAKRAKRTTKEPSKEPKEAGGGKKKVTRSPNKASSAKDKKKQAKKPAKKKDDEESKIDASEDDENYHPNLDKEESDEEKDEDFDDSSSDKPTKGKKGRSASAKKTATTKPSAKGKKGVVSRDEETETVVDYMKKQNRPYSLINIFDNLHGKIKKPQVQKILDSLTSAGELQMKEFGKAKIYLLNQKNIPDVNQSELDKISKEVQDLRNAHRQLTEEMKSLNAEYKDLQNQLTDEQIDVDITKYEKMIKEAEAKLKVYESGNYPKISDDVMKKAENKKEEYEKIFKNRKNMCMKMLHQLSEMADMKLTALMEEIGLDN